MNALKLLFLAKAYFKMVVEGAKIGEAIIFLVDPCYYVLPYLMIFYLAACQLTVCSKTWCARCMAPDFLYRKGNEVKFTYI